MRVATIDELHTLSEQIMQRSASLSGQEKKKYIIDEVYDLLVLAYVFGCDRVMSDITGEMRDTVTAMQKSSVLSGESEIRGREELPVDAENLYKALYKSVAGENFEERITRRIEEKTLDTGTLNRIVETDYHRMEETGAYDTAKIVERATGKNAYKTWQTMLDDRVRDTHWYIEGNEVPIDSRFYTFDGDSAMCPGDFELPENNINCRCELQYTFR